MLDAGKPKIKHNTDFAVVHLYDNGFSVEATVQLTSCHYNVRAQRESLYYVMDENFSRCNLINAAVILYNLRKTKHFHSRIPWTTETEQTAP